MENIYKRIPFDIELAKKIQSNEIVGRIVTNKGDTVRIICFDAYKKYADNEIIALVKDADGDEAVGRYKRNGELIGKCDNDNNLLIELPEEEALKQTTLDDYYEGNKVWIKYENNYILTEIINKNQNGCIYVRNLTSTPKILNCSGNTKAYKQKPNFKPFDKVLVSNNHPFKEWIPAFYQKISEDGLIFASGQWYNFCIPYEGNEHLVGTTDN